MTIEFDGPKLLARSDINSEGVNDELRDIASLRWLFCFDIFLRVKWHVFHDTDFFVYFS